MSPACNYRAYSNWSLATYPFFSSSKLPPMECNIEICVLNMTHCFSPISSGLDDTCVFCYFVSFDYFKNYKCSIAGKGISICKSMAL